MSEVNIDRIVSVLKIRLEECRIEENRIKSAIHILTTKPKSSNNKKLGRPGWRCEQLHEFLKQHGPLLRRQVIEKSGIPKGTIATYLQEKYGFNQTADKLWRSTKEDK